MWDLEYKESWMPKNRCFWTVVFKTLESPLDWKVIKPVHPKGNQPWIFIELTLKLKHQCFGHLIQRADSLEKSLMLGGIGGRRRRGQQRMRGGHHWLDGHEFEWTPGVGDGQGGLVCCSSWSCKESDMTEWLNWTELNQWRRSGLEETKIWLISRQVEARVG